MAYRYTSFNSVTLTPTGMDIGRGAARSPFVETIGGVYDSLGTDPARESLPIRRTFSGQVEGANAAALKTAWDAVLALYGVRGSLQRSSDAGTTYTVTARCIGIKADRTPHDRMIQRYTMDFDLLARVWDGADGTVSGVLDDVPESIVCANDGNARVDDAVITITAKTSAITVLTVAVAAVSSFTWTGTLAANKALVIDCGAHTVKNDGADAYSGFALDAGHTVPEWLRLQPGNNTVVVTRTGGDGTSTYSIAYSDGYI